MSLRVLLVPFLVLAASSPQHLLSVLARSPPHPLNCLLSLTPLPALRPLRPPRPPRPLSPPSLRPFRCALARIHGLELVPPIPFLLLVRLFFLSPFLRTFLTSLSYPKRFRS
jgi:hypothetical protein